jgi:D-beta-D-heptose 7-phosphate kinase/D-beta-D-heptose 1-phosphate adenosyltransferase
MKNISAAEQKIIPFNKIENWVNAKRATGKAIAFTKGCFDILHEGHIYSL